MREILIIGISPIGGGKEKEALEILRKHAKSIVDTVKKFEEMIVPFFPSTILKKQRLWVGRLPSSRRKLIRAGESLPAASAGGHFCLHSEAI